MKSAAIIRLLALTVLLCTFGAAWTAFAEKSVDERIFPGEKEPDIWDNPFTSPEVAGWAHPTKPVPLEDVVTLAGRLGEVFGTTEAVASTADGISAAADGSVSRKDAIILLHAALPSEAMRPVNTVSDVRGIGASDPAKAAVLAFLRAGILDDDPSLPFGGDRPLTGAQLDEMLERIVFPDRRAAVEDVAFNEKQAYLLCYTDGMNAPKEGIESGWEYDNRAGALKETNGNNETVRDFMTDERSRLVRYFNPVSDDRIEVFTWLTVADEFDGVSLEFCDESGAAVYRLIGENGKWCVENADGTLTVLCKGGVGYYRFRITVDLANGISQTAVNNADCGVHALCGDGNVRYFAVCTGVEQRNTVTLQGCYMVANYAVYEDFTVNQAAKPYDVTTTGDAAFPTGSMTVGALSSAYRPFDALAHTVSFGWNTLLPTGQDGMKVSLMNGTDEIVSVSAQDGRFYANGVDLGKTFSDKLWWKLRVEADFDTQKAAVKVNARVLATVDFLNPAFCADGVRFANDGTVPYTVDDIRVYNLTDYDVPAPVKPAGEEDYVLGVNVCSLWVNGEHWGWACVTPFDDVKPVLGYYDEGLTETADWENKFMAEHGVDFQAFCWYANKSDGPMKTTPYASQLDNAYLHSKYQTDVKFCLLWEAANASRPATEQDFYDYYVTYWMENYFSNPNYIVLDNGGNGVLFMGVFGADKLVSTFGGADSNGEIVLKRMWDTLDQRVRDELGYDGVIVSVSNEGGNTWAKYGFDAWNAYSWGTEGYTFDTNKSRNLSAYVSKDVYAIPTVSVGYNNIGWFPDDRHPLMTTGDYRLSHEWVRDTYLPLCARRDSRAWNDNLVWLSTWNEYGEGTYLMPCDGLNGFGYLDVLREVYSDGGAHTDVVPTAGQKARINHNYPQDKRLLRAYGNYVEPTVPQAMPTTVFDLSVGGVNYANCFTLSSCAYTSVSASGTTFTSSDSNPDVILNFKSAMWSGLAADDIKAVRVTASGIPVGQTVQLFYRTAAAPELSEANSIRLRSATEGEQEFVFDFTGNAKWRGSLNALRLDPLQVTNTSFTIGSVSFDLSDTCKVPQAFCELSVNGVTLSPHIRGTVDQNGVAYYPFEPGRSLINYYLYLYYDWNYDAGVLNLYRDGKTVTFTVGSDVCTVDGEPLDMEGAVYRVDNVPMLPIRDLARAFGFHCTNAGNDYAFTTPEQRLFDDPGATATVGNWTFGRMNNTLGWTADSGVSLLAAGDYLRMTSAVSTDPIIRSVDNLGLSCDDYPYLEIRYRGRADNHDAMQLGFYFTTTDSPRDTQSKYVGKRVANNADSDFETLRFDMSANENWTGALKRLRFDPFDDTGFIEVAYIRLLDANGDPVPEAG